MVIKIQGYKRDVFAFIVGSAITNIPSTAKIMSSLTSAAFNISEELRRQLGDDYRKVLIKTLRTLKIFRSLEKARVISLKDVSFLKDGLRAIQRKDLEKILTEFENKRNLTALVYMYPGKWQGFEESSFCLNLVEQEAGYLTRTTAHEISAERTFYKSLLESRKSIKKVMGEFDEVIRHKRVWIRGVSLHV